MGPHQAFGRAEKDPHEEDEEDQTSLRRQLQIEIVHPQPSVCEPDRSGASEGAQAQAEPRVGRDVLQGEVPHVQPAGGHALGDVGRTEGERQPIAELRGRREPDQDPGRHQGGKIASIGKDEEGEHPGAQAQPGTAAEGHRHPTELYQADERHGPALDPGQAGSESQTQRDESPDEEEGSQTVGVLYDGVGPSGDVGLAHVHPAGRHGSPGDVLEEPVQRQGHAGQQEDGEGPLHPAPGLGKEEADEVEEQGLEQYAQSEDGHVLGHVPHHHRADARREGEQRGQEDGHRPQLRSTRENQDRPGYEDHGNEEQGIVPGRPQAAERIARHPVDPGEGGHGKEHQLGAPEDEDENDQSAKKGDEGHGVRPRGQSYDQARRQGQRDSHPHDPVQTADSPRLRRVHGRDTFAARCQGIRAGDVAGARRCPTLHDGQPQTAPAANRRAGRHRPQQPGAGGQQQRPDDHQEGRGDKTQFGQGERQAAAALGRDTVTEQEPQTTTPQGKQTCAEH